MSTSYHTTVLMSRWYSLLDTIGKGTQPMFDFSKMDQAFAAMGELDGLLRAILAEQRTTNMLLAMLVGSQRGTDADADNILDSVLTIAAGARDIANGLDART